MNREKGTEDEKKKKGGGGDLKREWVLYNMPDLL